MKKLMSVNSLLILLSIFLLPSCELVGDIFGAGVWVGVLIVVGIIGLIIYLFTRKKG